MKRYALPVLVTGVFCSAIGLRASLADGPRLAAATSAALAYSAAPAPMSTQEQADAIRQYCVTCHNDMMLRGGLSLAGFNPADAASQAPLAEKMIRKLRAGMMPPKEATQRLEHETRMALVTALETTLDAAAAENPNPGRRSFQRLNRAEYAAAIRSMFGLDVDVTSYLPPDTISNNFDNIADVQMPSATVMQGYMRSASYVSRIAVGDPAADAGSTTYAVPRTQSQKDHLDGAPFGTRGGTVVTHNFPADGSYTFDLLLHGEPTGGLFGRTIGDIQMEVAIDGERVALVTVDRWISESSPTGLNVTSGPVHVAAGPHTVAATFLQEFEGLEDDLIKPIDHTLADTQIGTGYGVTTVPHLRNLAVVGPFEVTGVSDNPVRDRIFTCRPIAPDQELPCAREVVENIATQAYRRPLTATDLDELMPFYQLGADTGGFEAGIRTALQAVLASLHFIFRVEEAPEGVTPGSTYRISDVDLASRLSFFLWGTIPDRQLIDVAGRGELSDPAVFEAQVRRMLVDPRSEALATRFAAQWLRLQDLHKIEPDALDYPYYDEALAEAMYRETELVFDYLVHEDRSALELLTADYTFANERLARHYGIPGVSGHAFQKVTYPNDRRRGLLGHGSILTLTSHGNRTSPVLRGKWVLEVLLGSPPPPPPPDIPDLDETGDAAEGRFLSVAEQLAMHRANPACSSCHNVIDPIGLALDNFDVDGSWRIKDRGVAVNAAGELYDGTPINGVAELRDALVARQDVIMTHFAEVLLSYALGRRVEYYDMPTVRRIVRDAAADEYRMSSLILGVVRSAAFQTALAETTMENPRRDR